MSQGGLKTRAQAGGPDVDAEGYFCSLDLPEFESWTLDDDFEWLPIKRATRMVSAESGVETVRMTGTQLERLVPSQHVQELLAPIVSLTLVSVMAAQQCTIGQISQSPRPQLANNGHGGMIMRRRLPGDTTIEKDMIPRLSRSLEDRHTHRAKL
ncbi:hypothetical protein R1flu_013124 [Riccia fluitans]|uniref:Uncharacterized protein n=1 Tax=Riccia fluitans TaxID=41844 RepID=A0ABD1XE04_9MARC